MEKKILPWTKVGEPTVLAGKFGKKLVSQMFTNPATGKDEEFILFGQKNWSTVLPITENLEVVAVRQYKQGCNKIVLELPTGTADFASETPEQTMLRELLEETGYEPGKVIALPPAFWIATRSSYTQVYTFLATGCKKVKEAKLDLSEEIETELIPLDKWLELCASSIEEPSAIVATFRSIKHLVSEGVTLHF